MKKLIAIFCIMLLAVFTFAACSSKKEGTKEQTQNIRVGECFVQAAIPEKCRKNSRGAQLLFLNV
ncbi:hypothetical protein NPM06_31100, partial [Bacillus cereus]|nr:hypothetical protein [Bacillus cereus]